MYFPHVHIYVAVSLVNKEDLKDGLIFITLQLSEVTQKIVEKSISRYNSNLNECSKNSYGGIIVKNVIDMVISSKVLGKIWVMEQVETFHRRQVNHERN